MLRIRKKQKHKAENLMFWRGLAWDADDKSFIRIDLDYYRKIRIHLPREYVYACGRKCLVIPCRKHNNQKVIDAWNREMKRRKARYATK